MYLDLEDICSSLEKESVLYRKYLGHSWTDIRNIYDWKSNDVLRGDSKASPLYNEDVVLGTPHISLSLSVMIVAVLRLV